MLIEKNGSNCAIITRLTCVRAHPNADRLKLATVLGTQVVVGLDAKEGDLVAYFDSNLALGPAYLKHNNLYSNKEQNIDPKAPKGYFGNHGRVKAQRFRGEISNGYVAELRTLLVGEISWLDFDQLQDGVEFTHINGVEICHKYIPPTAQSGGGFTPRNKVVQIEHFWKHWDTKQLMREKNQIPTGLIVLEEKIHGTSGRTGLLLCSTGKRWWQFWKSAKVWKVVSGTRRVDHITSHIPRVRKIVEDKLAPHLHKGEEVYYEIYGCDNEKRIQSLSDYGCSLGEFRVLLYRVTITTEDGHCVDLSRRQVYKRAEELGLERPTILWTGWYHSEEPQLIDCLLSYADGRSTLDENTLREGFVLWYQRTDGTWNCLKHKSAEFLMAESAAQDHGDSDVEDVL